MPLSSCLLIIMQNVNPAGDTNVPLAQDVLSYIGGIISIVFLIITVITYLASK